MVKFHVSILNKLKMFFLQMQSIYINNVIFNKTVTKLVTVLANYFLPYLNPTSYLKKSPINTDNKKTSCCFLKLYAEFN